MKLKIIATLVLLAALPGLACSGLPPAGVTVTVATVQVEPPAGEENATVLPGPTPGTTASPQDGDTPNVTLPVPPTRTPGGTELPPLTPVLSTTPAGGTIVPSTPTEPAGPPPIPGTATSPPDITITPGGGDFPALSFVYSIRWEIAGSSPATALATVSVTPEGGNGDYTIFHDGAQQAGNVFTFEWPACEAKSGTIGVTSGDGQSLTLDYVEMAPCPATFTPVPM